MLESKGFGKGEAFYCWSLRSEPLRAGSRLPRLRSEAAELAIGVDVAFLFDKQDVRGRGAALRRAAFGNVMLVRSDWPRHSIARSADSQRLEQRAERRAR